MPKVRSASILFKQEVSYDLPVKTNSLEIGDSLGDYEFFKGRENERSKKSCESMQTKTTFNGYKSKSSDSSPSSESSSDPDLFPPVKQPIFGDVWNKFNVVQNDIDKQETKDENLCFTDCLSTKGIENTKNNSSLPLNSKQTILISSINEKSSCLKNSVLSNFSLSSALEIDDDLSLLCIENNLRDNFTFSPSDLKEAKKENNCMDNVLNWNRHSSSSDLDVCLSDMLASFETCGVGNNFKIMKFTQPLNFDDRRNLPGVEENSSETTNFSDLLDDICLQDKNEKLCSSYSSSSSGVDSFLNCINLTQPDKSSALKPEIKLKNLDDGVPCNENISLAALAEQHLQSSRLSNSPKTALKCDSDFSSLIKEPGNADCVCFLPFQSETFHSTIFHEKLSSSCSSSSDVDSFLNCINLTEPDKSSAFKPEIKCKNFDGGKLCDENISLAALAEQHLQSSTLSNSPNTALKCNKDFFSLIKEPENTNSICFSPFESKTLDSSTVKENDFDFWADLTQNNSMGESKNIEPGNATLQVINDGNEDYTNENEDIDLTSCLKSLKPETPLNDSCLAENNNENFVADKDVESPVRFSPLLLRDSCDSPSEVKNNNINRSLFARSLSSKPRKNVSAMLKVLELQTEICSHFFSQSLVSVSPNPVKEKSIEANQSVVGLIGRRVFGQITPCEVL